MMYPDRKDSFIATLWLLQFFVTGCIDISFSLSTGDIYYNKGDDTFSDSLWLLITGVIVAISSVHYPTYSLTRNIHVVLPLLVVSICALLLFGMIGLRILQDITDKMLYIIYFCLFAHNMVICGGSLVSLLIFLYLEYSESIRLDKLSPSDNINYVT